MKSSHEDLSDSQWEFMKEFLPTQRKRKYDLRNIVNAILFILRTGTQWRNLPNCYPPWQSVYYYFRKWHSIGILERINNEANKKERLRQGKEETPSLVCIDSQSVKVAPFINEEKGIDGNKKVNGRKRHILVDTLGLVWAVIIHAANIHDGQRSNELVEHILGYLPRLEKILVDDAYKAIFLPWVESNVLGLKIEFASKPPTQKGFVPVKKRWVNERTFGWYNFFRRLSKDYEKTPESSEAWVLWANTQILLNRFPN
ncbi:MAG: IS5 family transposase [Bacteroidetes bacterium]|nr:MAG: IS5 family transposase [Bacteroidota bacterium]